MRHFQGKQLFHFNFCISLNWARLIKGRGANSFFESRTHFSEDLGHQGKQILQECKNIIHQLWALQDIVFKRGENIICR